MSEQKNMIPVEIPENVYDDVAAILRSQFGITLPDLELRGQTAIVFGLHRRLECEDETYSDSIAIIVPKETAENNYYLDVEELLRKKAQAFLVTKVGWKCNVSSNLDYNWGDLVEDIYAGNLTGLGVYMAADARKKGVTVIGVPSVNVNQDDHIAPYSVPAEIILRDEEGNDILPHIKATIDFTSGETDMDDEPEDVVGDTSIASAVAVLDDNGEVFKLNVDDFYSVKEDQENE